MSKSSTPLPHQNIPIENEWDSHPLVEWFVAHKKILIFSLLALLVLLIFAARIATWRTLNAESDFFQSEAAFTQYQKLATNENDKEQASQSLAELTAIMDRRPELKPKYEGPLAQTLLINGQIPEAEKFIDDIFNRTKNDHLQLYQDYTKGSVLIGQGNYPEALRSTEQFNAYFTAPEVQQENPTLHIFSLIRLAFLYQQMNQPKNELNAWQELQKQLDNSDAFLAVNDLLQMGQATLTQYIEERNNELTKSL